MNTTKRMVATHVALAIYIREVSKSAYPADKASLLAIAKAFEELKGVDSLTPQQKELLREYTVIDPTRIGV